MSDVNRFAVPPRAGLATIRPFLIFLSTLLFLLCTAHASAGSIEAISVTPAQNTGSGVSADPLISRDGRYVAFYSSANDLVSGSSPYNQAYWKDRVTGELRRVSVNGLGQPANWPAYLCDISDDGLRVAFYTAASNMGHGGGRSLVYVHDTTNGTTRLASRGVGGPANSTSDYCALNEDGSIVAFRSFATNLVAPDLNGSRADIFVHDLTTGMTTLASVTPAGMQGNDHVFYGPDITPDGRYVVFSTRATNLVTPDLNGYQSEVFVKDRATGSLRRANITASGGQPNRDSWAGLRGNAISDDGRYVVFFSYADNIIVPDLNGQQADVFVRDMTTGAIELVNSNSSGAQANGPAYWSTISADGKRVATYSYASNMGYPFNGQPQAIVKDRSDRSVTLVSKTTTGQPGTNSSVLATISGDGLSVAFYSHTLAYDFDPLVNLDSNSTADVFVSDLDAVINQPPTAVATANPNPGQCNQNITFSGANSFDPDGSIVSWTWGGAISGSGVSLIDTLGVGTWNIDLTVEDNAGETDTGSISVLVADNVPPTVSAGPDVTLEAVDASGAPYTVPYTVEDSCDPSPSFSVLGLLSTYPIGTSEVEVQAWDASDNRASDSAFITVADTTPPVVTVPSDITQEAGAPTGNTVTFSASAEDAVDGTRTTTCSPASGSLFPIATTGVTCSAPDKAGNEGSAGFNVTIQDTTPPVLDLPADITAEAASASGATVSFSATAIDIADPAPSVDCAPPSGSTFGLGTTAVSCSATDASGNAASGSFNVTVVDTTPPVLTLPSDIVAEATSASGAAVSFSATASDTVDPSPTVVCSANSGDTFGLGTTPVNCRATDATGNVASASFNVTVVDTTPPVLTVPSDLVAEATSASGAAVSFSASASDTVDPSPTVVCSANSGDTFGLGTTPVSCSATDASGNAASGSFNVKVVDTTPPVLTVPSDIVAEATSASGAAVSFSASATDTVDSAPSVVCAPVSGSTFGLGTTPVSCSATDASGNAASGSFNVKVVDTTPPSVTPPADVTVEATGPQTAVAIGTATADDNVGVVSISSNAPASFPLGLTVVTWTAVDAAGNEGTATQNVTVDDTTPPVVTVPADITTVATMPSGAVVTFSSSAFDLVDLDLPTTCSPASGGTFGHGTTAVTCRATDEAGNTGSASFNVTVLNAAPTADSQSVTLDEDTPTAITLTGSDVDDFPVAGLTFELLTFPSSGTLSGIEPNLTYTPDEHWFGSDSFTFRVFDGDLYSGTATVSITVDPVNDLPVITVDRDSATMQYSDTIGTVVFTAYDVDDDLSLGLSQAWVVDGGADNAGLPAALTAPGGCSAQQYGDSPLTGSSCSWTMSGQMQQPSGSHVVTFTVTDNGGGTDTAASESASTALEVLAENAKIVFHGDNPVAVPVIADGVDESEPFTLVFDVLETLPDAAAFTALAGDISLAIPEVDVTLTPVGPGSPVGGSCVPADNGLTGYDGLLTFTCDFDAVPVNTYSVDVSVNGGYYTGSNDDVLTVYDPSLGFTTGGGWFYWPGTSDKTNFGYTMKYNKKRTNIQGSLLLIRHIEGAPEGEDKWRLKSNSLEGLSLGDEIDFGWAAFSGKATYKAPGVENEGNHEFTIYVEDLDEPGAGFDRIWVQSRDKSDDVIDDLSLPEPAVENAATIEGGNIFVPHATGGGRGRK